MAYAREDVEEARCRECDKLICYQRPYEGSRETIYAILICMECIGKSG
jgi:ribosomal protein L40E